jgi:hypothetical protein
MWVSLDNPECFFCQTAVSGRFRLHSGQYHPPQTGPPKSRPLNEIEKVTVLQERFELAYAVPPKLIVLEIDGVPDS